VRLAGSADEAAVIAAVAKAGFTASVVDANTRTREKARRAAEYRDELRRFWIAVVLTLPLVAQMPFMFGEHGHANELPRWLQLTLATPVQFWIGWRWPGGSRPSSRCSGCRSMFTSRPAPP